MKVIHLKCGHKLSVKTWPSKLGLAKVRHHYKKFHPGRMKKMTKKSLATKKRKGLIYYDREKGRQKVSSRKEFRKLFKNPILKWYVGSNKYSRKGEIFQTIYKPIASTHGHLYLYVTGPFKSIEEAQKYKRGMDLA